MDIATKAKNFATLAHKDQKRKSEPDLPMIIHPIAVAEILASYGYDENIVAAGYLHDVVEDTKYTIEDIQEFFGPNIASLVKSATEPDKKLPWKVRKLHTINEIKKQPLGNKLVVAADKIHNIETLTISLRKKGMKVFDVFRAGYEDHLWYMQNVYNSVIFNQNPNIAIFKRFKKAIDELKAEINIQQMQRTK